MFDGICRTCAKHSYHLTSIFEKPTETFDLTVVEMLKECASIQISDSDCFPKLICSECLSQILKSYEFQRLCQKSENYFLNKVIKYELEVPSKIEEEKLIDYDGGLIPIKYEVEVPLKIEEERLIDFEGGLIPIKHELEVPSKIKEEKLIDYEGGLIPIIIDESLRIPIREFPQERKFDCEKCHKWFTSKPNLRKHRREVHGYGCKICGVNFRFLREFKDHIKEHEENNQFNCKYCDEVFPGPNHLKDHLKSIHQSLISYVCEYCGKNFMGLTSYTLHVRIHTGEKRYQCPVCSKQFTQKQTLQDHEAIHSSERPFVCEECALSFKRKAHLRSHQKLHIPDVVKYKCEACGKQFRSKFNLQRHIKLHEMGIVIKRGRYSKKRGSIII